MSREKNRVEDQIREIAERVASAEGMEVVEAHYRGSGRNRMVRVFIDKPEGVSHRDCELISRQLSAILDVEDLVPGPYRLEVSSPGLDRKLVKEADYQRFVGKKARVQLRQSIEGKRQLTGRLVGYDTGDIALEVAPNSVVHFRLEDVEHARLVVEF